MRKYREQSATVVTCNQCGRVIPVKGAIVQEDVLRVEKDWGYFSRKDGARHRWDLCEECYDKLIQGFAIPAEIIERTELL